MADTDHRSLAIKDAYHLLAFTFLACLGAALIVGLFRFVLPVPAPAPIPQVTPANDR